MRDYVKMLRPNYLTAHAISKMVDPHVDVFGYTDGVRFEIYLYKKNGGRWVATQHQEGYGFTLTIMEALVRLGIPRENFKFIGSIFENGRLAEEPNKFLSSIKTEEEKP
jgi:hypothetical protein